MNDLEEDWPDVASTRARRQAFVDQQLGLLVRNADPLAADAVEQQRQGLARANQMFWNAEIRPMAERLGVYSIDDRVMPWSAGDSDGRDD